eukprot:118792-Alexandrium_andersonii.AAC.1
MPHSAPSCPQACISARNRPGPPEATQNVIGSITCSCGLVARALVAPRKRRRARNAVARADPEASRAATAK